MLRDQFLKTPRSSRWYDMHTDKKDSGKSKCVPGLRTPVKLNNSFSRVARHNLPSAPSSRSINQDTLRSWKRSARECTFMCNQAAHVSRCLTKVQESMVAQLKTLNLDRGKGKTSGRSQQAVHNLEYLVTSTVPSPRP